MSSIATIKQLSTCCAAKAKVNATGSSIYFCSKCGQDCTVTAPKAKPKSTLSTMRKVTGERELFIQMYAKAGGKSAISGAKLLPPEHPMFHFQFSHILGKGTFPELRLMEENITPCTVDEHAYYTEEPEACRKDPAWAEVFKIRERLMLRAHAA